MSNKKIIAISGYARTGKDTLCNLLISHFSTFGLKAQRFSFADALKEDLFDYVKSSYGVDIFQLEGAEKELFRPLMLWKGYYHRVKSEGTYFHEIVRKKIEESPCDIAILTDLRYAEYENDEVNFVKDNNGFVISLRRYSCEGGDMYLNRSFVKPANEDEKKNQAIIDSKYADIILSWDTILDKNGEVLDSKRYLLPSMMNYLNLSFNQFLKGKHRKALSYDI